MGELYIYHTSVYIYITHVKSLSLTLIAINSEQLTFNIAFPSTYIYNFCLEVEKNTIIYHKYISILQV